MGSIERTTPRPSQGSPRVIGPGHREPVRTVGAGSTNGAVRAVSNGGQAPYGGEWFRAQERKLQALAASLARIEVRDPNQGLAQRGNSAIRWMNGGPNGVSHNENQRLREQGQGGQSTQGTLQPWQQVQPPPPPPPPPARSMGELYQQYYDALDELRRARESGDIDRIHLFLPLVNITRDQIRAREYRPDRINPNPDAASGRPILTRQAIRWTGESVRGRRNAIINPNPDTAASASLRRWDIVMSILASRTRRQSVVNPSDENENSGFSYEYRLPLDLADPGPDVLRRR